MAKRQEVIDVGPAVSEEQTALQADGGVLAAFLAGVGAFMARAGKLEGEALVLYGKAEKFEAPTTAAADAELQRFVQTANAAGKAIVEHWEVTSAFHRMHKRLVALRERGASKAVAAAAIAQGLHNRYVEDERRRAAEEQERRRLEAEAEAARERALEAERLEQEAVAREEALGELSDRERRFVELFAFGLNTGQTAARAAGFKDPAKAASRLLALPKIIAAVKAAQAAQAARRQAAATRERPLEVRDVERVQPAIEAVGTDRTTWRGEVLDERAFVEAVIGGRHGIPADCLTVNRVLLNEYARSMHGLMDRWPGVRAVKSTKTL